MATKEEHEASKLYLSLMEEVKARILSINTFTADQRGVPSPLVREYCFLQLRMVCEAIALGCLVANGDLVKAGPASLRKAYAPGEILKTLEQLHDDFYPVPIKPIKTDIGWHMDVYDGGEYLTKQELPELWWKCGDILHKGSLKKLAATNSPFRKDFDDVTHWGQRVFNLLSNHRIISASRELAIVAFLQVDDMGGNVQVVLGEASSDVPFDAEVASPDDK